MLITKNKAFVFVGYTLLETLFVLTIVLGMFMFPIFSISSWQQRMVIDQFFNQLDQRIYATQKIAIVSQQLTSIFYDQKCNQIVFDVPKTNINWSILKIPFEIEVKKMEPISFSAKTGNESTLKAYQFYWKMKKQTIIYQFQMGSGHYIKKIK
ncbi:competence type IV pilus minor pilin ComGD [Enterococcus ratti]|uniref:competence type IV pilus minor pilin ComGD n=1 Tax=Enterococcus ratti TaxID=150033 RepID=UPI00090030FD|nr:competence type IV pilus minor pilin ComGD [Enterococcus ratti]